MNPDQYYVRSRGRVSGPYSVDQLREMRRRGNLTSIHEISTDQDTWRLVSEAPDLFGSLGPPAAFRSAAAAVTDDSPVAVETGTADAIAFRCPHCQAKVKVPSKYAGRASKCRACDKQLQIPEHSEGWQKCPACAEMIRTEAKKCKHCGERLDGSGSEKAALYTLAEDEDQQPAAEPPSYPGPYRMAGRGGLPATQSGVSRICPSCGTVVPATALVCTNCGFNYETGRHVSESASVYTHNTPARAIQHNVHVHSDSAGVGQLMAFEAGKKSVAVAISLMVLSGRFGRTSILCQLHRFGTPLAPLQRSCMRGVDSVAGHHNPLDHHRCLPDSRHDSTVQPAPCGQLEFVTR